MAVWTSYLALLSSPTFISSPREKLVQWLGDYSWTFSIWNGFGSLDSCYLSILFLSYWNCMFQFLAMINYDFAWNKFFFTPFSVTVSLVPISICCLCLLDWLLFDLYLDYLFRWMIHTFRIYDRNCFQYLRLNIP